MATTPNKPEPGAQDEMRAASEKAMNDARFFPAELCFAQTKSPSGRDEYVNSHLQSNWYGWQAGAQWQASRAPVVQAGPNGWLQSGALLYRLTDERNPKNCDEIRVTMADGDHFGEGCTEMAYKILTMRAAVLAAVSAA